MSWSVFLLWHPWLRTTNPSYSFPLFEWLQNGLGSFVLYRFYFKIAQRDKPTRLCAPNPLRYGGTSNDIRDVYWILPWNAFLAKSHSPTLTKHWQQTALTANSQRLWAPKKRIDLDAQGGICHSSSQPILLVSCISHSSTLPQRTHHSTRTHVELPWNPQLPETSKTYQNFHVWNLPITLTLTRCGTVPARNANAKCHPTKEPSRNTCSKTPTGLSVLSDFLL